MNFANIKLDKRAAKRFWLRKLSLSAIIPAQTWTGLDCVMAEEIYRGVITRGSDVDINRVKK